MTLVHVLPRIRQLGCLLAFIFLSSFLAVVLTPLGFPYTGDPQEPTPQRFFVIHTNRMFNQKNGELLRNDSGIFVMPWDYNGVRTLPEFIPEAKNAMQMAVNCDKELYCGFPYYLPVLSKLRWALYIPAPKPKIHSQPYIRLISQNTINLEKRRLTFNASGSDHLNFYLSPAESVTITEWSLGDGNPLPGPMWQGRPTYFIYYSHAEDPGPFQFWVDIEVSHGVPINSPLIHVVLSAHYMHGPDSVSPELAAFIKRFPSWTYSIPWTATYQSWVF